MRLFVDNDQGGGPATPAIGWALSHEDGYLAHIDRRWRPVRHHSTISAGQIWTRNSAVDAMLPTAQGDLHVQNIHEFSPTTACVPEHRAASGRLSCHGRSGPRHLQDGSSHNQERKRRHASVGTVHESQGPPLPHHSRGIVGVAGIEPGAAIATKRRWRSAAASLTAAPVPRMSESRRRPSAPPASPDQPHNPLPNAQFNLIQGLGGWVWSRNRQALSNQFAVTTHIVLLARRLAPQLGFFMDYSMDCAARRCNFTVAGPLSLR